MFPQRLQEEEEEEEEVSGLLNLLFLILVSLSWLEKKKAVVLSNRPCPSLRNDLPSKTTWHAKVVQWKFILPYESKVSVISFLRLSVNVKIRHFGLNKRAKRTAFQKRKVLGQSYS